MDRAVRQVAYSSFFVPKFQTDCWRILGQRIFPVGGNGQL